MKKVIGLLFCLLLVLSACGGAGLPEGSGTASGGDSPALPEAYAEILGNLVNAYLWDDDPTVLVPENPELSYLYRRNSQLAQIGFALVDLDRNGQAELIISDPDQPFIYDLYTLSEGTAVHLFASGERYCFYLFENGAVENQWSGAAVMNGHDFYRLENGKLMFLERILMDAYHALDAGLITDISQADEKNTFFRSPTENEKDYIPIPYEEAIATIETYQNANDPLTIEFTLLSEYKQ